MKMYEAEVLADSMSPHGVRLTSVAVTYPHAVHKDMLRHRLMSRVVESFRARPPELLIEALRAGEVFRPDAFAKRVKGMQQGVELDDVSADVAQAMWDEHIEHSLMIASEMVRLDIAKQQVNFVLQDLCPVVEIITATDWSNFRALRTELKPDGTPVARPEVYRAAKAIMDAIDASEPEIFEHPGRWHLPLVTEDELYADPLPRGEHESAGVEPDPDDRVDWEKWALVSAGRCARVSYDKHRDPEPIEKSIERAHVLTASGHMSPFEQCARPLHQEDVFDEVLTSKIMLPASTLRALIIEASSGDFDATKVGAKIGEIWCGNFRGWVQLRKTMANEHDYSLLTS